MDGALKNSYLSQNLSLADQHQQDTFSIVVTPAVPLSNIT